MKIRKVFDKLPFSTKLLLLQRLTLYQLASNEQKSVNFEKSVAFEKVGVNHLYAFNSDICSLVEAKKQSIFPIIL